MKITIIGGTTIVGTRIVGTRIVGTTQNSIKAVVALMQLNYSETALMIFEGLPYNPDSNILKIIQNNN